ncbi:hypothetical protein V1503_20485 [Bacillus sp. SCS-151]|uniref:hypothetical protein n=1 Tax=Nanhaiella sioensis TaxID=3115293 RepID=UPI003978538F
MRKSLLVIMVFIIILLFAAYLAFLPQKQQSVFNVSENDSLYINSSYKNSLHRIYQLNLESNKVKLLFEKELDDYPTSAFNEESHNMYYSGVVEDGTRQLLVKNIKNDSVKKLANNLNYVDFLQIDKTHNIIYMRVLVGKNDRNFHVATYNINTAKIDVWDKKDTDTSVVDFDFNPTINKVLVISKSIKEEFENISYANENNVTPDPPTYKFSIYSQNGSLEKHEIEIKKFVRSASLSPNGETILFNYKDRLESSSKIATYNRNSKKTEILLEDPGQLKNIREPLFNSNNSVFYFIADNIENNNTSIYFFDLKSKKIQKIWTKKNEDPINIYS